MIQNKAAGRELYDSLQVPGTSTEVSQQTDSKELSSLKWCHWGQLHHSQQSFQPKL